MSESDSTENPVSPEWAPHREAIAPGFVPPPSILVREQRRLPGGRMAAPAWEPPPFPDFHIRQLRQLGLNDEAIETLRQEVANKASHVTTSAQLGGAAVRLAEQRAKEMAKADLDAVESTLSKDEIQRRFDALGFVEPVLGDGPAASSLSVVFLRRSSPVYRALHRQMLAERALDVARKSAVSSPGNASRQELTEAKLACEIAQEHVHAETEGYRQFLRKYDTDAIRARVAEFEELLPGLPLSEFEEDLLPFVVEAGEAFDAFRAVVGRVRQVVDERNIKLAKARAIEHGLGLREESLLPNPSQSIFDNYLSLAMRCIGARVAASDVLDFVSGVKNPAIEGTGPLR